MLAVVAFVVAVALVYLYTRRNAATRNCRWREDRAGAKGALVRKVCETIAATEPRAEIDCKITSQYRNMRYWLEDDMTPVELARAALADLGIPELSVPIRGGTDGSRLTEMGVPCPNLYTGMQNIHGPLEWVSVQDMEQATALCLRIAERAADGS